MKLNNYFLVNFQRGEVESALTDYARVNELQPSNVVAITRQAMHKFNKRYYISKINSKILCTEKFGGKIFTNAVKLCHHVLCDQ